MIGMIAIMMNIISAGFVSWFVSFRPFSSPAHPPESERLTRTVSPGADTIWFWLRAMRRAWRSLRPACAPRRMSKIDVVRPDLTVSADLARIEDHTCATTTASASSSSTPRHLGARQLRRRRSRCDGPADPSSTSPPVTARRAGRGRSPISRPRRAAPSINITDSAGRASRRRFRLAPMVRARLMFWRCRKPCRRSSAAVASMSRRFCPPRPEPRSGRSPAAT